MAKGSIYEREICKLLSLWWSGGESDNIFWRTSQSGGRATQRAKKNDGKKQAHAGDITAIDSSGNSFVQLVTVEIKRGYKLSTVADIIDAPQARKKSKGDSPKLAKAKEQKFAEFVRQSKAAAKRAGTPFWALIHRRDRRMPYITIPYDLHDRLFHLGSLPTPKVCPLIKFYASLTDSWVQFQLDVFLANTEPNDLRILYKRWSS
jgi:hypothetical protein